MNCSVKPRGSFTFSSRVSEGGSVTSLRLVNKPGRGEAQRLDEGAFKCTLSSPLLFRWQTENESIRKVAREILITLSLSLLRSLSLIGNFSLHQYINKFKRVILIPSCELPFKYRCLHRISSSRQHALEVVARGRRERQGCGRKYR